VSEFDGELTLQFSVCVSIFTMRAKVVSKRNMRQVRLAAGPTDIEVMREFLRRGTERFTSPNTQVALVLVPDGNQSRNREREVGAGSQEHIDVDDGLGRQARHGRATDVFNRVRYIFKGSGYPDAQQFKILRPKRVIVLDDYRIHDDASAL
jgi:hypothetical protein